MSNTVSQTATANPKFSRANIHDVIVSGLKEVSELSKLTGGAKKSARSLNRAERDAARGKIYLSNEKGRELSATARQLTDYANKAKASKGFKSDEAKALASKSKIMGAIGKALETFDENKTPDKASGEIAKIAVAETAKFIGYGADEIPIAVENFQAIQSLKSPSADAVLKRYSSQVNLITSTRNSSVFLERFGSPQTVSAA